ncbi:MAG: hypothetical protein ABI972_30085 [Acidobacteriota bacterium]
MKFAALLLAVFPALAQTQVPVPSPFAIREEILADYETYEMPALMHRLGLPGTHASHTRAFTCAPLGCSASVIPLREAVISRDASYILELCAQSGSTCRLIAFYGADLHTPNPTWRVVGFQDAEDRYGVRAALEDFGFAIDRLYGSGSGVVSYHREWFTITESAFRSQLNTVSYGRDMNVNPMRSWRGQFIAADGQSKPLTVTFLYFIEFKDRESGIKLFDERRLVAFSRESPDTRFQFDAARSELSTEEIDTFFEFDNAIAHDEILSFARASLLSLARSGTTAQKQWLTNYLAAAPASAIKSELTRALAQDPAK